MRFGWREAELTWYGSISLRGVKHGWTEISRGGVVHLEEEEEEESEMVKYLSSFLDGFPVPRRMNPAQFGDPTVRLSEISEPLQQEVKLLPVQQVDRRLDEKGGPWERSPKMTYRLLLTTQLFSLIILCCIDASSSP